MFQTNQLSEWMQWARAGLMIVPKLTSLKQTENMLTTKNSIHIFFFLLLTFRWKKIPILFRQYIEDVQNVTHFYFILDITLMESKSIS